jgi:uncharacterized Zn finger protein (UPF0148 family)
MITICPICGKSVLYRDGNRLVCPICNHSEKKCPKSPTITLRIF